MRIGIVCKGETTSRHGFKVAKIGDLGVAEIYKAEVKQNGGKHRFLRRIKKCAERLRELGIYMCAAEKEFEELGNFGIALVSDGFRIFRENAGMEAMQFAQAHGMNGDFLIIGGSFGDVIAAAQEILRFRRYVYIENPAFDEIAAEISEQSGAVARKQAPEGCCELYLCDAECFLKCGDITAGICDFKIRLPGKIFDDLQDTVAARTASMLRMSGVLRKNEIKVEYFPK